mmetsp:Transcript_117896/g.330166  ORF Transcript_117896/g.330166 Transcript_117896/m.330166 type:complete len:279 (-) Transcript_117896:79-915(-)
MSEEVVRRGPLLGGDLEALHHERLEGEDLLHDSGPHRPTTGALLFVKGPGVTRQAARHHVVDAHPARPDVYTRVHERLPAVDLWGRPPLGVGRGRDDRPLPDALREREIAELQGCAGVVQDQGSGTEGTMRNASAVDERETLDHLGGQCAASRLIERAVGLHVGLHSEVSAPLQAKPEVEAGLVHELSAHDPGVVQRPQRLELLEDPPPRFRAGLLGVHRDEPFARATRGLAPWGGVRAPVLDVVSELPEACDAPRQQLVAAHLRRGAAQQLPLRQRA